MGKDRGRGRRNHQSRPYNKSNWRGQKTERSPHNGNPRNRSAPKQKCSLLENQVGITEFTNADAPGFTGILKSRFSDFHVNEIDAEGHVLELNDSTVPKAVVEAVEQEKLAEWRKELEEVIGPEVWKEIDDLAQGKFHPNKGLKVEIDASSLDKDKRTKIHQLVKQLYTGKLFSSTLSQPQAKKKPQAEDNPQEENQVPVEEPTVPVEEKKTIRIFKPKQGRGDNRWSFPAEYVTFLVHKTNIDTIEVASNLAWRLHLRPSQVNYCGTKDKRAKTTQKFSVKHRSPDCIIKAARSIQNVFIGNFGFRSTTLKLGDLQGNRFRIALRHIAKERQGDIEASLASLKERGFINYYGLQRFGNSASVPTYEVGVALLKRDYKTACELILKPRDTDIEFMRAIREEWWEKRDSAAAAAQFYGDKFIEKKLLDGLASFGESDYSSALRQIPRNMLMLYPHAYQSLIFNRIASRRIKQFGLKLIPGDLVYVEQSEAMEEDNQVQPAETEDAETDKELPEGVEEDVDVDTDAGLEEESVFKRKVRPLSEEDISSGKYQLFDVVLPLPGYDITYPANECGAWYEEMMAEVGLSSELLKHKEKTYALGGAYRKMIIQPNDLKWSFRRYNTPQDILIASDFELMKGIPITAEPSEEEAQYLALVLEFSLPTAAYATMLLRELFKQDTSTATQMQLEQEAMTKKEEKQIGVETVEPEKEGMGTEGQ